MNPTRLLMLVVGVFLIARLVKQDSHSETLAGRLAGGQPPPFGAPTTSTSTSSSSAAAAASKSTSSGAPTEVPLATTSESETAFARSFLTAIKAPLNRTNMEALADWWSQEEGSDVLVPGHGGLNNPFEVTTSGDANVPSIGSVNSAGVKSYATPKLGIEAAIGYFEHYGSGVLQAFRSGQSISSIEAAVRALGPNAFGSDTNSPWGP